jgi:hypothetical protein
LPKKNKKVEIPVNRFLSEFDIDTIIKSETKIPLKLAALPTLLYINGYDVTQKLENLYIF